MRLPWAWAWSPAQPRCHLGGLMLKGAAMQGLVVLPLALHPVTVCVWLLIPLCSRGQPPPSSQPGSCSPRGRALTGEQHRDRCFGRGRVVFLRRQSLVLRTLEGVTQGGGRGSGGSAEADHSRDSETPRTFAKDRGCSFRSWRDGRALHRRGNYMSFKAPRRTLYHTSDLNDTKRSHHT